MAAVGAEDLDVLEREVGGGEGELGPGLGEGRGDELVVEPGVQAGEVDEDGQLRGVGWEEVSGGGGALSPGEWGAHHSD